MQGPSASTKSFKKAFLKNLLLSLCQARASSFGNATTLHERKLTVKYPADVAMAVTRAASCTDARWPKAILSSSGTCKAQRSRSIVRTCCCRKRSWERSGRAGGGVEVARRLVRRRTMALREVIPGGRDAALDEATLLREAMDYAVHLRAQVDVLHRLSQAVQRSSSIYRPVIAQRCKAVFDRLLARYKASLASYQDLKSAFDAQAAELARYKGVAAGSGRHVLASIQELRAGGQRGQRHVLLQQDEREAHLRRQGPPLWRRRLEAQWVLRRLTQNREAQESCLRIKACIQWLEKGLQHVRQQVHTDITQQICRHNKAYMEFEEATRLFFDSRGRGDGRRGGDVQGRV